MYGPSSHSVRRVKMSLDYLKETLKKHRRALHQIPEIAFDLPQTHAYVKKVLVSLGFEPMTIAQTGLIAIKKGVRKETIAFRSDMDALNVLEQTNVDFASKYQGKMHACGHDGHMAMLLGFAEHLSHQKSLQYNVMLIFQPAEEGPGGAKIIVDSGILEKHHVLRIFGIHLYPDLKEGIYGLVDGPMMAQNGEFDLSIKGVSAHGAQPHASKDAIIVAAQLITQYQHIVSRQVDPLQSAVVTIGTIEGGEARNIIAHSVHMKGTIRAFHQNTYDAIKESIRKINAGLEMTYGVNIDMDLRDYYPAVINDHQLFLEVQQQLKSNSYEMIKPMMFAEDFSFYQQVVPGLFVMLGTKNESLGYTHPLHSCYFNFLEDVLTKGVELYDTIARTYQIY